MLFGFGKDLATGLIVILPVESCLAMPSWTPFSNFDATTVLDFGLVAALPLFPYDPFFISALKLSKQYNHKDKGPPHQKHFPASSCLSPTEYHSKRLSSPPLSLYNPMCGNEISSVSSPNSDFYNLIYTQSRTNKIALSTLPSTQRITR
jgi:hypothetical protein